jgi:NADPH-dependent curcumin reductase CurA
VSDAVLPLLNPFARVPACGLIAYYNDARPPDGPDRLAWLKMQVLVKRLMLRGFIVSDFARQRADFLAEVGPLVRDGRIKYRGYFIGGLEQAPRGLIGLLRGENFGKTVVRVAPEGRS